MIESKIIRHFDVSGLPIIYLGDTRKDADVHFLATDGTPVVLTMPKGTLERLRERIDETLSDTPPATPSQCDP